MSMFSDLLRRKDSASGEEPLFDQDGTFEHDIEAALDLDVEPQFLEGPDAAPIDAGTDVPSIEPLSSELEHQTPDVLTPHAQAIMASFNVFEEANASTREELAKIGKAFTSIVTNYNIGRQFLDGARQEIARTSELEQANHRLVIENRRLLERTEKQESARERQDDVLESAKRREARLLQDIDALRMNLSDLRLEIIELRNANSIAEHARSEMHVALASKAADGERLSREIDVLREKLATLTSELDTSQKRQTETRLRLEEMQSQQAAEANKYAELNGRAVAADKEILRLQKQCDATEAQLREAGQSLQNAEHDIWERDRQYQSEAQALRAEIEQLTSRLTALSRQPQPEAIGYPEDTLDGLTDDVSLPVIPLRSRAASKARSQRAAADEATSTAAE